MKNPSKQWLSRILLGALLLGLASCGDSGSGTAKDTSPADSGTQPAVTEDPFIAALPDDLDFGGKVFHIGQSSTRSGDYDECAPDAEESKGDIIHEAVRKRNQYVEDKLNIRITSEREICSWTDLNSHIQYLVMAGDTTYDAFCANIYGLFMASINGMLLPLNEIPTLDLSNRWWDDEVNRMGSLGSDTMYFVSGAINYLDDLSTTVLMFNRTLCERLDLELPYQLVRDGKWTLDTFHEYVMSSSEDVDGSGDYTTDDLYGLICNAGAAASFLAGSNAHIIVVDDTGAVTINQSEHLFNALDQFFVKFMDKGNHAVVVAERKFGYEESDMIFPAGRGLFRLDMVEAINEMRMKMEDDFGVLPVPKYDEAQKSYYNLYNTAHATGYSIPITEEDPEMIGRILDLMGYYSEDTVYPAVIEKNVLVKGLRDEESAEMLDLIFHTKFYDMGQWGSDIYNDLCSMCESGKNQYASKAAAMIKKTQKQFGAITEYYSFD